MNIVQLDNKIQTARTIAMIRPVAFRKNEQTAVNNYFQEDLDEIAKTINSQAQREFDAMVKVLQEAGITVVTMDDDADDDTPDSIFPNNWVSTHANGDVAIYPMYAENRRKERRERFFTNLEAQGFVIENIIDYTAAENEGFYLEGTGSMVLDRAHEKAYCALSPRADEQLFIEFCEDFEFFPVVFNAYQDYHGKRLPIYHTNVMMCMAEEFCVICLDCIDDKKERKQVLQHLKTSHKEVIAITEAQMNHFAGNMLELRSANNERIMVMSSAAYHSLTKNQVAAIEKYDRIVHSDLHTIETCGGGSARCMMAEIFLPKA